MVEDKCLARILSLDGGPQDWVDRMIAEANRRGGLDDITAIVIRIESVDSPAGVRPAAGAAPAGWQRPLCLRLSGFADYRSAGA